MTPAASTSELPAPQAPAFTPAAGAQAPGPSGLGAAEASPAPSSTGPPPSEGPPGGASPPQSFGELLEESLVRTAKSEDEKPKAKQPVGTSGHQAGAGIAALAGAQAAAANRTQAAAGRATPSSAGQADARPAAAAAAASAAEAKPGTAGRGSGGAVPEGILVRAGVSAAGDAASSLKGQATATTAVGERVAEGKPASGAEATSNATAPQSSSAAAAASAPEAPSAAATTMAGAKQLVAEGRPEGSIGASAPGGAVAPSPSPRAPATPLTRSSGASPGVKAGIADSTAEDGPLPSAGATRDVAAAPQRQAQPLAGRAPASASKPSATSSLGVPSSGPKPAQPDPAQSPTPAPLRSAVALNEGQAPAAKGIASAAQSSGGPAAGEQPAAPGPQQVIPGVPGSLPTSSAGAAATSTSFMQLSSATLGRALRQQIESLRATVALAVRSGGAQARISLSPPELGALRIRLTQTEGGLIARVSAESGAAAQALSENQGELRNTLASLGITLLHLDISGGSAGQAQAGGSQRRPRTAAARTAVAHEQEAPAAVAALGALTPPGIHQGHVNVLA